MAPQASRTVLVKIGDGEVSETFTTVAGVQSKSIAFSNGTLDVTNDDSSGVRTLLEGLYGKAFSISVSGIAQDDATLGDIRTAALAGTANNFQFVIPGSTSNGTYEGSFIITSLTESGGGQDEAYSFECTFESAGAVTFS